MQKMRLMDVIEGSCVVHILWLRKLDSLARNLGPAFVAVILVTGHEIVMKVHVDAVVQDEVIRDLQPDPDHDHDRVHGQEVEVVPNLDVLILVLFHDRDVRDLVLEHLDLNLDHGIHGTLNRILNHVHLNLALLVELYLNLSLDRNILDLDPNQSVPRIPNLQQKT